MGRSSPTCPQSFAPLLFAYMALCASVRLPLAQASRGQGRAVRASALCDRAQDSKHPSAHLPGVPPASQGQGRGQNVEPRGAPPPRRVCNPLEAIQRSMGPT